MRRLLSNVKRIIRLLCRKCWKPCHDIPANPLSLSCSSFTTLQPGQDLRRLLTMDTKCQTRIKHHFLLLWYCKPNSLICDNRCHHVPFEVRSDPNISTADKPKPLSYCDRYPRKYRISSWYLFMKYYVFWGQNWKTYKNFLVKISLLRPRFSSRDFLRACLEY